MAIDKNFDIEQLLNSIKSSNPSGSDLRRDEALSGIYYEAKDARTQARTIERLQVRSANNLDALIHWDNVIKLSCEILQRYSKDLEVSSWLIEACLRKHGFAGLRIGLELTRKLIEGYWDTIYPNI